MALSTTSNWLCNFIIAFITPPLFSSIAAGYYFLLLGFCVVSGIFVFFVYPETAHRTLEELGEVFGDKVIEDTVAEAAINALSAPEPQAASEAQSGSATTLKGSNSEVKVVTEKTDEAENTS